MKTTTINPIDTNTGLICKMTGMTKEQYSEAIYWFGMQYLRAILGDDQEDIAMMSTSSHFWKWWTKQWQRTDRIFANEFHLQDYEEAVDAAMREWLFLEYRAAHHGISQTIHPNRFVMKQGFQMQYRRAALKREEATV